MPLSRRTQIGLRYIRNVVVIACIIGPIFSMATGEGPISTDALHGLVDGALIALSIGAYAGLLKNGPLRGFFRRRTFTQGVFINACVYLALLLTSRALGQFIVTGDSVRFIASFSDDGLLTTLPFGFAVAFIIEFIVQMNRMVGANVLRYFITGAYHHPKQEERVFLFLDLKGSTKLTETLGSAKYYALLRQFVDLLSDPILETYGTIHEYAGDEVVITWSQELGYKNANCIRCDFMIEDAVNHAAASFEREIGVVPQFRAGLHGGPVVTGELGDIHQEIVYVGDILNVAARLEEYAKQHDCRLLTSGAVLSAIQLPSDLEAISLGDFQPRGKESCVAIFRVDRKRFQPIM